MITITNGKDVFKVSKGAFESIYKKQGFKVKTPKNQKPNKGDEQVEGDEKKLELDAITEKPVAQWTKAEIKVFAEAYEVDLTGTKNATEAKEIIKEFMSKM